MTLNQEFEVLATFCVGNDRPLELLQLWRERIESNMRKEDIFDQGIYRADVYTRYPMNLINDLRFLKLYCYFKLEDKLKKVSYDSENLRLYKANHTFEIFNMFDMYTYVKGMKPLLPQEKYTILRSFTLSEKKFILNMLYPSFPNDFSIAEAFQFKAFEAYLATDDTFVETNLIYSDYEKFKYNIGESKTFYRRLLLSSLITVILGAIITIDVKYQLIFQLVNLIFFQFGFLIDKMLFYFVLNRRKKTETMNSCRRVWRRLRGFMEPHPSSSAAFALNLCVEDIQDKKHIEYKFHPSKYDHSIGKYYLVDFQAQKSETIKCYVNTGFFFWLFLLSEVKITRRKIRTDSFLTIKHSSPEFYLIDFDYRTPYPLNPLSRIICLQGLFELVKLTLEEHFEGAELKIIKNGFVIKAPNTHTRVKISAISRYVLDHFGITNRGNKTDRYQDLKDMFLEKIATRIEMLRKDIEAPAPLTAKFPFKINERLRIADIRPVEVITYEYLPNPLYTAPTLISEYDFSQMRLKKSHKNTVGWLEPQLDYENRCLKPDCEILESFWGAVCVGRRIAADFDSYAAHQEVKKSLVIEHKSIQSKFVGYKPIEEEIYPEMAMQGYVHRKLTLEPVCSIVNRLGLLKNKHSLNWNLFRDMIDVKPKKKKRKMKKMTKEKNIENTLVKHKQIENREIIKEKLKEVPKIKSLDHSAKLIESMAVKRVKASGIYYEPCDKGGFERYNKHCKKGYMKRYGHQPRWIRPAYKLNSRLREALKEIRSKGAKNTTLRQAQHLPEYLTPYFAKKSYFPVSESEKFKQFMICRRLTDYGVAWGKTFKILSEMNVRRKKLCTSHLGIHHQIRNAMRNCYKIEEDKHG
jgi:hypothetical protein